MSDEHELDESCFRVEIELKIPAAKMRARAEDIRADMLNDEQHGGAPATPVEQIEVELLEGWAQELAADAGGRFLDGLVATWAVERDS